MRKFALALALFFPFLAACAGGSSRYGCPAEQSYSCKSVSEVYADASSGQKGGEPPLLKSLKNKRNARAAAGRKFLKGRIAGKNPRRRADKREAARPEKAMPVYVPPLAIRLWIAPWQDARGVFHSGKYVYLVSGRGRWTIGGKTVPLGESSEDYPGEIRLVGTERAP